MTATHGLLARTLLASMWITTTGLGAPSIGGDPRVNPADFRITTFATGLNYPNGMVALDDDSLLVGTTRPLGSSGFYSSSVGELVRLVDANADGVADGPATTLFTGLPGQLTAVARAGDLILATTSSPVAEARINILRSGATPTDPLSLLGSIDIDHAVSSEHTSYALAVRPLPGGQPTQHQVFFNIGSVSNAADTTASVALSGMINAPVAADSIFAVTIDDNGSSVQVHSPVQIARGLRNAAGIAFDPFNGDLYFEDNGIDTPSNRSEALSADELNMIEAANIGQSVPDFGFSTDYIAYRTGQRVVDPLRTVTQPVVAFTPIPDPASGAESEGAAQIAFTPAGFPVGLNRGVFIGFHGQFNLAGAANEENPLVYVDLTTGDYFHFISTTELGIGHLDGLLATNHALFLADLAPLGSVTSGANNGQGTIYMISVIPEPATAMCVLAILATALITVRRTSPATASE